MSEDPEFADGTGADPEPKIETNESSIDKPKTLPSKAEIKEAFKKYCIKETDEALDFVGDLVALIGKQLRDGFQPMDDALGLVTEAMRSDFVEKAKKGVGGITQVPAEIKDLDMDEIARLVGFRVLVEFKQIKDAFEKD